MSDHQDPHPGAPRAPRTQLRTHRVTNQPPPLEDFAAFDTDQALVDAVAATDGREHRTALAEFGLQAGSAQAQQWARQANRCAPELRAFDRYGQRIDEVEFHPAYHALMKMGLGAGVSSLAWTAPRGGHVAHAAMMILMGHADSGVCCPFSMTYAAVPTLRHNPSLAAQWEPLIRSARYDGRSRPAGDKTGVTIGMAMTEKQGGSDVRANTTRATPVSADSVSDEVTLSGHKWFCSAPMSDGFLTLAQCADGLGCYFVPRWRPDGTRNGIQIVRLKDKLGDRSNASSEIDYHDAWARRVGAPGRGVRTIIDMVQGTRLDCLAGSTGIMRAALSQALWHCRHRHAFGQPLIAQPLMAQVLADLCLEVEAATALTVRLAASFDRAAGSPGDAAFVRLATPIAKYWICKRTPGVVYEAMECLGGAGYVEDSGMPRLFRQSPLNSIWEGSGNVIALDVLRALQREPDAVDAVLEQIDAARGVHDRLDAASVALRDTLTQARRMPAEAVAGARGLVERAALVLQAVALAGCAPAEVAEAFCLSRLDGDAAHTFGAGRPVARPGLLLERAMPELA